MCCVFVRHRLAQFLTDRARNGTNRVRILPGVSRAKKNLKKKAVWGRDLLIANLKEKSRSKWYQSIQNFLENKINKKNFEKKFMLGRDLVINVELAQFLTDRAQSGINRFRMLPGVS